MAISAGAHRAPRASRAATDDQRPGEAPHSRTPPNWPRRRPSWPRDHSRRRRRAPPAMSPRAAHQQRTDAWAAAAAAGRPRRRGADRGEGGEGATSPAARGLRTCSRAQFIARPSCRGDRRSRWYHETRRRGRALRAAACWSERPARAPTVRIDPQSTALDDRG